MGAKKQEMRSKKKEGRRVCRTGPPGFWPPRGAVLAQSTRQNATALVVLLWPAPAAGSRNQA
jgi:hypothetical protein